ncbi:MAG TPA: SCO family protein [Candidatus Competibacteraceae bacterium]|nr:SCO family protein [Candidatus Competibacteraceae bacterium]HPF57400.1 SCO family protein [Candidatus Competibacteraceae bacterium]HRY17550.1 SCO family protein [Candidatus Competibacteraceae bacterium]
MQPLNAKGPFDTTARRITPRRKMLLVLSAGILAFGLGLWLNFEFIPNRIEPPAIAGIFLAPPKPVEDFTLIDQNGQQFNKERWRGKWTFLYFGYTFCPDVCPLALLELNKTQKILAQENLDQNNAYLLISVDPNRDTPERLGQYATYFNPRFKGATGTPEQLAGLARQFGVYYKIPDAPEGNYTVDHSSTVMLIDPQIRLRAVFTDDKPEIMAADFRKILEYDAAHNK